jgi:hypothetical protein
MYEGSGQNASNPLHFFTPIQLVGRSGRVHHSFTSIRLAPA